MEEWSVFPKHVSIGARLQRRTLPTGRGRVNTKEVDNPTWERPNPITARLNLYKDDVYPVAGRH